MKYVSIDLETTGLYPKKGHQILTLSGILEDTNKRLSFEGSPKLNIYILRDSMVGSPFALSMNSEIISSISKYQGIKTKEDKIEFSELMNAIFLEERFVNFYFYIWCLVNIKGEHNLNDLLETKNWVDESWVNEKYLMFDTLISTYGKVTINVAGKNFASFDKKFIDSFPVNFYKGVNIRQRILDPAILFIDWENDDCLPDLTECKKRANIDGIVTHDSLYDAWDVIQSLRAKY